MRGIHRCQRQSRLRRGLALRSAVELLELRRLLSVAVSNSVLVINGTANADVYVVARSGSNTTVTENGGAIQSFATNNFLAITVDLGNGGDSLTIADAVTAAAAVVGGPGNDTIKTGGGNDAIDPGTGDDSIDGGPGNDTVGYASRTDAINGGLHANYTPQGSSPPIVTITGTANLPGEHDSFVGVENLTGGAGTDDLTISADDWDNPDPGLQPVCPPLRVNGNGGDDTFTTIGSFSSTLGSAIGIPIEIADGGNDNDTFLTVNTFSAQATDIGGPGDDYFDHLADDDLATIDAGAGFDTFHFNALVYRDYTMPAGLEKLIVRSGGTITGNDDDNTIQGDARTILGMGGNDSITLSDASFDTNVDGGSGNDSITGSAQNETIHGGTGNDLIIPGGGSDSAFGDNDDDTLKCVGSAAASGLAGLTTFSGGPGADSVVIDDTLVAAGVNYSFFADSIGTPTGDVAFTGVGSLELDAGGGADSVSVSSLAASFVLTIDGGGGIDTFNVQAGATGANVNIAGGAGDDVLRVNTDNAGTARAQLNFAEVFGSVSVGLGGQLFVKPNGELNALRTRSLSVTAGGVIDLGSSPLIVDYTTTSPLVAITTLLRTGYNGGTWTGLGIRSSSAAGVAGSTLGVAATSELSPIPTTFFGQSVDSTTVIVRYTRAGDINLDRTVDFSDLVVLAQNYNLTGRSYARGDVDYSSNGKVDFGDLVIIAQQYGMSILTTGSIRAGKGRVAASVL